MKLVSPVFRLLSSSVRPVFRLPSSPVRSHPLPSAPVQVPLGTPLRPLGTPVWPWDPHLTPRTPAGPQ
eukprot:5632044-Prymnesium_polylepis.1